MRSRLLASAAVLSTTLIAACSGFSSDTTSTGLPPRPDEVELIEGVPSEDGTQIILGTPDVAVGTHRMAFVLQSEQDLVRAPHATVVSRHLPEGGEEGRKGETAQAVFRPWPYEIRGSYTTRLTFDAAGRWQIDVTVMDESGHGRFAQLTFQVDEATKAPDVGAEAPPSESKTLTDVEDIGELTTGSLRDPDLYRTTIAGAIDSGMPTVIVMASPAFCINAVCGPQVEVLQQLKDKYEGQANFIHVDLYDNPDEIQGDLSRSRISPTVLEWQLPSAEWSFVIDLDGKIAARFESFATFDELEQALEKVLSAPTSSASRSYSLYNSSLKILRQSLVPVAIEGLVWHVRWA